jgi:hypothetical protein
MSAVAVPDIEMSRASIDNLVNSVGLGYVQGDNNSISLAVQSGLSEAANKDIAIQSTINRLRQLERNYLPLYADLHLSRLRHNPERYITRAAVGYFIVGIAFAINEFLGAAAFVIMIVFFFYHLYVRNRIIWRLKREIKEARELIINSIIELRQRERELSEGSQT